MCVHGAAYLLLTLAAIPCQGLAGEGPAAKAQRARIAAVIEPLGDLDLDKQNDPQQQLARLGEGPRAALLEAIEKHEDAEVRRQARVTLHRINAEKVNRLVKRLTSDQEAKERQAAEKELSRIVAK